MLEQLLIFTRGGLILWSCNEIGNALKGSPIDTLIRSCLLEERSGASSYNYDAPGAAYSLKWTFHNDLGLVFVAVYQRILHLLYVDDLLAAVKREFSQVYDPTRTVYRDFDQIFKQLKIEAEARAEDLKKSNPVIVGGNRKQQVTWKGDGSDGKKNGSAGGGGGGGGLKNDGDGKNGKKNSENDRSAIVNNGNGYNLRSNGVVGNVSVNGKENDSVNNGAFDVNRLQKKVRNKGGNGKKTDAVVTKAEPKKVVKKNRVWDEKPVETKLDFTDHVDIDGDADKDRKVDYLAKEQGESMMDKDEIFSSDSEDEEDDDDDNAGKKSKPDAKKKGWFSSMFQR